MVELLEVEDGRWHCDSPDICKRAECPFYDVTREGIRLHLLAQGKLGSFPRRNRPRETSFACRYTYTKRQRQMHRHIIKDPSEIAEQLEAKREGPQ